MTSKSFIFSHLILKNGKISFTEKFRLVIGVIAKIFCLQLKLNVLIKKKLS